MVASKIQSAITELRQKDFLFDQLFRQLETLDGLTEIYVVGGTSRDVYLGKEFRDVDLMIDALADGFDVLNVQLSAPSMVSRNQFGGLKIKTDTSSVDLWTVKKTLAFRDLGAVPSAQLFPKTTFLDIDSLVVGLISGSVYEHGFFNAVASKTIELNWVRSKGLHYNILRSFRIAKRHGFAIGPKLAEFVLAAMDRGVSPEQLTEVQHKIYGDSFISREDIDQLMKKN